MLDEVCRGVAGPARIQGMAVQLERHPGGRPRVYDREAMLPKLIHAFSLGAPIRFAAQSIGVPKSTLEKWMASDDELGDALRRAQADGVLGMMDMVRQNPKTAGGAGWLLERRYREDFGQRVDVTHSIDEAQVERLAEQYGVDAADVRSAIAEAAKLLSPPKK